MLWQKIHEFSKLCFSDLATPKVYFGNTAVMLGQIRYLCFEVGWNLSEIRKKIREKFRKTETQKLIEGSMHFKTNWYGRPNPESWNIEKPEGQIFDWKAGKLQNQKAEFNHKAEYIVIIIPTQYIILNISSLHLREMGISKIVWLAWLEGKSQKEWHEIYDRCI